MLVQEREVFAFEGAQGNGIAADEDGAWHTAIVSRY